jgi:hypothetical protein
MKAADGLLVAREAPGLTQEQRSKLDEARLTVLARAQAEQPASLTSAAAAEYGLPEQVFSSPPNTSRNSLSATIGRRDEGMKVAKPTQSASERSATRLEGEELRIQAAFMRGRAAQMPDALGALRSQTARTAERLALLGQMRDPVGIELVR